MKTSSYLLLLHMIPYIDEKVLTPLNLMLIKQFFFGTKGSTKPIEEIKE